MKICLIYYIRVWHDSVYRRSLRNKKKGERTSNFMDDIRNILFLDNFIHCFAILFRTYLNAFAHRCSIIIKDSETFPIIFF